MRVRQRDTGPEVLLRRALWAAGLRYRTEFGVEGVRVDIALPGRHLAILVDGCSWHGCPIHATQPNKNAAYWIAKLERNRTRDNLQTDRLKAAGWTLVQLWAHESTTGFVEATRTIVKHVKGLDR